MSVVSEESRVHITWRRDMPAWLKKLNGKFVILGDIRLDPSNKNVFLTDSPSLFVPHQFTVAVNLIYLF